jgi:segregation and condensation protein A
MLSWEVVPSPLNFHLEQYEGPLDLLLDLIRRQKIDIWDIPIAQITAQYLEYMQQATELDFELGSEFVFMAATLIHIKSRMLLPKDPELEKLNPEEDPRQELVERLLEHERYKNAAEMLQQKRMLEEAVWSNPQIKNFLAETAEETPGLDVTLFDLVKTFQQVLERAKTRPTYQVTKESVSVPDMIMHLRSLLRVQPGSKPLRALALFEAQKSRRAMICLFLAILELVKMQAIEFVQDEAFGEISLKAAVNMDEALASEETVTQIDKEYN